MEGAAAGVGTETGACSAVKLPGFRFHPTDEELVRFYLRKRMQQQQGEKCHALSALQCLIPDLDIYKYDPWDLPQLAKLGEGHSGCYFFSPRDRKYRNSTRPNRVSPSGFWKATGADRLVHSSGSPSQCIGLKKSLVFYLGRASRGTKTDWMMHEFRLPNQPDHSEKDTCWALCKIFKRKTSNSQCMSETQACVLEDLLGMTETEKFEALGSLGGEDCSEADSKSENTAFTSVEQGHMPSSVDIFTPPSCTSQDDFTTKPLVKSAESTENVAFLSRNTEPLTLRLSKSFNGWADELCSAWVSPAIMTSFDSSIRCGGGPAYAGDMSVLLTNNVRQEPSNVAAPDCVCSSPQWTAPVPLWDTPVYFHDPMMYKTSSQ